MVSVIKKGVMPTPCRQVGPCGKDGAQLSTLPLFIEAAAINAMGYNGDSGAKALLHF